jgi:hypothetical protein
MVESILKPNAAIAEHYENRLFTSIALPSPIRGSFPGGFDQRTLGFR